MVNRSLPAKPRREVFAAYRAGMDKIALPVSGKFYDNLLIFIIFLNWHEGCNITGRARLGRAAAQAMTTPYLGRVGVADGWGARWRTYFS
jgi:hypothetical protein